MACNAEKFHYQPLRRSNLPASGSCFGVRITHEGPFGNERVWFLLSPRGALLTREEPRTLTLGDAQTSPGHRKLSTANLSYD